MLPPTELQSLGITLPPTEAELPYHDGEPMESQRHQVQMELLINALLPWLDDRTDGDVGVVQNLDRTGMTPAQIAQVTGLSIAQVTAFLPESR